LVLAIYDIIALFIVTEF